MNFNEVEQRVKFYNDRLELLNLRIDLELKKPYKLRSDRYLQFLALERTKYEFSKGELKSLFYESSSNHEKY